jgi:hypothetical protein
MTPGETPHFRPEDFISYLRSSGVDVDRMGVPPRVVLTYVGRSSAVAEDWGLEPAVAWLNSRPLYRRDGSPVGLHPGPVGAPAAVSLLEELKVLGVRECWLLGFAGSLSPDLPLGTVWTVDRAWPDEGTSRHYGGGAGWAYADPDLLERVRTAHPALPVAPIWTTDAIYRETPSKIRHFTELGAAGVDMETSALFWVGERIGVKVAALMVISDELFHPWRPGFRDPRVAAGVETAYRTLKSLVGRP